MRSLILAAGLTLGLTGSSLAQGAQQDTSSTLQNSAQIQQQVKQNLGTAGFTDINVMPESFLVRAKDRDGNPVMMIINPDSVTAVTALGDSGNTMNDATDLTPQQRQKVAQLIGSQPSEPTPPNFQPRVGQAVPSSVPLKSLPASAESQLPASLKGDQFAKLNSGILIVDPSTRKIVALISPSDSK